MDEGRAEQRVQRINCFANLRKILMGKAQAKTFLLRNFGKALSLNEAGNGHKGAFR